MIIERKEDLQVIKEEIKKQIPKAWISYNNKKIIVLEYVDKETKPKELSQEDKDKINVIISDTDFKEVV